MFAYIAGAACLVYWLIPRMSDPFGKTASFIFCVIGVYFSFLKPFPFPWYLPPVAMLGIVTLVCGFFSLHAVMQDRIQARLTALIGLSAILALMTWEFAIVTYQMRLQETIIENGMRKKIGEWLHERIAKDDRVYLECLGYIGYFSEAKMLDFPGLVTPSVQKIIRAGTYDFTLPVKELKPEWLVLRLPEADAVIQGVPDFMERYELSTVFDATPAIDALAYVPNPDILYYDRCFLVFHKKP